MSYKPQHISFASSAVTVDAFLRRRVPAAACSPAFASDVLSPLGVDAALRTRELSSLSGGECQRVALAACLGRWGEVDAFLVDEPSAHLDCEQRVAAAKVGHVLFFTVHTVHVVQT